jgi:hypothetical protein
MVNDEEDIKELVSKIRNMHNIIVNSEYIMLLENNTDSFANNIRSTPAKSICDDTIYRNDE